MTPEEKLAQRFGLQWSDMKDLKSTFEAFGMMSESGGIEHVDELKLCFRAIEVTVEDEDWQEITQGLGVDSRGHFRRFGWEEYVALMAPYMKARERADAIREILCPGASHPLAKMGAALEKVREKKKANAAISAKACSEDPRLMFLDAAKRGDLTLLESLLAEEKAPLSLLIDRHVEKTKRRDLQGKLAVTLAASRGHASCVAMLLDRGAPVSHPGQVVSPLLAALGSQTGGRQHEQGPD